MVTERVDRGAWDSFLESFSMQYRGWIVTLLPPAGASTPIENLPLLGIAAVGDAIVVRAGSDDEGELREHRIAGASEIRVDRADNGGIAALRVASPSGETALAFRSVLPPELVDGVV